MAIEIYLVEEAEKLFSEVEDLNEWRSKVEELGLDGQKTLAKPDKSPIPFLRLKATEIRVYSELCPIRTLVKDYKEDMIPLRVLSLIALAEREKYFGKIEIWHNFGKPDPVVIGYKATPEGEAFFFSNDGIFIIARWGDELKSFDELKKEAIQSLFKRKKLQYEEKLKILDILVEKYFEGEFVNL